MKIKYKIALLFTLLVILILTILGIAVYYFSSLNREREFSQRLRNRALTTTRLLLELDEMNRTLLKKIDSLNVNLLTEERIAIFNDRNELFYLNRPDIKDPLNPDIALLDKIRKVKKYEVSVDQYEIIGNIYKDGEITYVVIASAIDTTGIEALNQLRRILLLSGFAGILIAILTGFLFSVSLLKPLNRIITQMNDISFQNISKRIAVNKTPDELNLLAIAFNELLVRLEDSFYNQKRFISNASHELSTPLAAISSQLEVSLMQTRSGDEYRSVMISVQEDVNQLNNLVKKLLELAKAGTDKGISLQPVRVDEIVLSAAEEINTLHQNFQVSCSFEKIPEEESLCFLFGNEELLFIAFKNIIENACKYSPAHKAWVSISFEPDKKLIRIKDEGIGIPKDELQKVFEPFFRSQNAEAYSDGFGLGLAMSSRIIRLHKGDIRIESLPGKGSTFIITLPAN